MKLILTGIITFAFLFSNAQVRVDGTFPFQTDTAKKYSLYIPSGYNTAVPHRLMLGLHPLNTAAWNSISWCDTLTDFAEANNLVLVCPDGGPDGAVDDPIDTAFTSALLDSMSVWYNIDTMKTYVMGFSWGGKTTYTYGLNHSWRFGGFIPIGAAISGTTEVNGIIQNANGKPFFLVHGGSDSPNTRFYPVRTALIANNAIEKDTLMPGIGHTINFPNRNQILSMAFQWIDSVNCAQMTVSVNNISEKGIVNVYPVPAGAEIFIECGDKIGKEVRIFNSLGAMVKEFKSDNSTLKIHVADWQDGIYTGTISTASSFRNFSFVVAH